MINSRSDAFKVWSGPLFKAIEEVVYQMPEFVKHIPVPERPAAIAHMKKANRNYYQTDFTAFESHFTPEMLMVCECQLYSHCLSNYPDDANFINGVISGTNRMRTRTGVHAQVRGRRMSGDMCTSLGNGFTNLMLAKYIAHEKGGELTGFVEGDDGIFATDVQLTAKDYEDLGFTIKIETVDDPCTASFCGMIFAESGEIIRDPRKSFQTFGWSHSFIQAGPVIMDQLLRAKALSSVYETPQCPIVGVLARQALNETRSVHPRFVSDGYHVLPDVINIPEFEPSHDTRLLFERCYGISISQQLLAERMIEEGNLGALSQIIPPSEAQADYTSRFLEVT